MSLQILAKDMASRGRGPDSTLVHMSPREVDSLQIMAERHGGSLTINPETGLPEAGFLDSILPVAAGFMLGPAGFGVMSGLGAAATVGGVTGLLSGDLGKGLMAGLGAFGGHSMSGALDSAGGFSGLFGGESAAAAAPVESQVIQQAAKEAGTLAGTQLAPTAGQLGTIGTDAAGGFAQSPALQQAFGQQAAVSGMPPIGQAVGQTATIGNSTANGFPQLPAVNSAVQGQATAAAPGATQGLWDKYGKYAPLGVMALGALDGQQPLQTQAPPAGSEFAGFTELDPRYVQNHDPRASSAEQQHFAPTPQLYAGPVGYAGGGLAGMQLVQRREMDDDRFAAGGIASLDDGSFVVDARTVSELGNGSSSAGQQLLAELGGTPVKGAGDGVSDSIPAVIEGDEEARVANDEVVFSKEAVARIGGGDPERGAERLYSLMERAKKARQEADEGEDTGLRAALGGMNQGFAPGGEVSNRIIDPHSIESGGYAYMNDPEADLGRLTARDEALRARLEQYQRDQFLYGKGKGFTGSAGKSDAEIEELENQLRYLESDREKIRQYMQKVQ